MIVKSQKLNFVQSCQLTINQTGMLTNLAIPVAECDRHNESLKKYSTSVQNRLLIFLTYTRLESSTV